MSGMTIDKLSGRAVYVEGNDIDTDRIIPARYLTCVTFDELGPALFYDVRFDEQGNSKGHVLDSPEYSTAEILISDNNFGCGSSREHAPQAIMRFGLKAVIAGSFAEIFHGNCTTLGIPCVVMNDSNRSELSDLIMHDPTLDIMIDIVKLHLICANKVFPITMKDSVREAFLNATYDPLDTLLASQNEVKEVAGKLGYL
ncbi:MAG: 3-isopropylmalate dehydratase small subunit [Gammaproteobacteria bacterium]|uniref:3-isopropylmalate dehydratase n=1 Tax=OM182 bacterium TaxID=2510334 RepID=A0A520RXC1_9GAMM|nr:3-isopropylmalate dehydratase small subunit [Gammaproteobacteria bacterium]OUV67332.1 MAG: 3-isopropylmalate dehydratase small subunit [Gammaproteobacteria bacterium TMED133]RZO74817.1 MAG: 3-isopropylmalate dehydratase small subunit [OM182 bacterium]